MYINHKKVKSGKLAFTDTSDASEYGNMQVLITDINRYQYKNGKVSKTDNVLKTLQSIEAKAPKAMETIECPSEITTTDCIKGLAEEFTTTGNGKLNWNICLSQAYTIGYAHGSMGMKLAGCILNRILISYGGLICIQSLGSAIQRRRIYCGIEIVRCMEGEKGIALPSIFAFYAR